MLYGFGKCSDIMMIFFVMNRFLDHLFIIINLVEMIVLLCIANSYLLMLYILGTVSDVSSAKCH